MIEASAKVGGAVRHIAQSRLGASVRALFTIVLLATALRVLVFSVFLVPSGSMLPTLVPGDLLLVNKLAYGPLLPFVEGRIPGYARPERFDVIVFETAHGGTATEAPATLVKRVVAVGGDTIAMRSGTLYVNGHVVNDPTEWRRNPRYGENEASADFGWQKAYTLATSGTDTARQPTHDNWGPLLIPAGSYFVLGDNRYESRDSRYIGLVAGSMIIGRAACTLISIDAGAPWREAVRLSRSAKCNGQRPQQWAMSGESE